MLPKNFALTGIAGYIAPRHLDAIHATGHRLIAAMDPHDAVGILDRYAFDVRFFTEFERFDRHLEKLRRGPADQRLDCLSICSPNYLHDAHIRLALRVGADAICEKPLVINPWNLDALQDLESETGRRVWTVLQLRLHPSLLALKARLETEPSTTRHEVDLAYVTARGLWYGVSWKGSPERSGGLVTNIGIHLFDLLLWLFGSVVRNEVSLKTDSRVGGFLELERADVRWFLSSEAADLPFDAAPGVRTSFRTIAVDGTELDFTEGIGALHTKIYEETLAGRGFGIDDARPSVELCYRIREAPLSSASTPMHPMVSSIYGR